MNLRIIGLLALALALVACATQRVGPSAPLSRHAAWALLPIVNQSQAPQAGERAEDLVETELRLHRLDPARYPARETRDPLLLIDEQHRFDAALAWAREQGLRYGITGSVQEWRYKSGLDGEPAVGLTLRVIDIPSGRTLWAASGSRTGWGYASLSGTAAKVVRELLGGLNLTDAPPPP